MNRYDLRDLVYASSLCDVRLNSLDAKVLENRSDTAVRVGDDDLPRGVVGQDAGDALAVGRVTPDRMTDEEVYLELRHAADFYGDAWLSAFAEAYISAAVDFYVKSDASADWRGEGTAA